MRNLEKRESLKRGIFKSGNLWEFLINRLQINFFIVIISHTKAYLFSGLVERFKSRFLLFEIRYTDRRIEPPGLEFRSDPGQR